MENIRSFRELKVWLRSILDEIDATALDRDCEEILAMLTSMAAHPEKWAIRSPNPPPSTC